jgi:hypothetical protein
MDPLSGLAGACRMKAGKGKEDMHSVPEHGAFCTPLQLTAPLLQVMLEIQLTKKIICIYGRAVLTTNTGRLPSRHHIGCTHHPWLLRFVLFISIQSVLVGVA